ncbi:YqaA family protein [Vibrio astriarenae]
MTDFFSTLFSEVALWFSDSALWVLFITGFLSATLLPGGSEAGLIATLSLGAYSPTWIIIVATIGNTLGGMTNYLIGLWIPNRTESEKHGHKALAYLKKYGYWSLLFSWLPVIGDPLCLAAGWLRMNFWLSTLLVLIGKAARYCVLTTLFYGFF